MTVKVRPAKDAPWQAVEGAIVEIAKDRPCAIRLPKAVTAQAVRLEIVLRPDVSAGLLGWSLAGAPPAAVPPEKMREIYETVKTPYKRGMVLTPEKGEMLDNPSVFRHKDAWYMIFIRFDGKGYETHLAKSESSSASTARATRRISRSRTTSSAGSASAASSNAARRAHGTRRRPTAGRRSPTRAGTVRTRSTPSTDATG